MGYRKLIFLATIIAIIFGNVDTAPNLNEWSVEKQLITGKIYSENLHKTEAFVYAYNTLIIPENRRRVRGKKVYLYAYHDHLYNEAVTSFYELNERYAPVLCKIYTNARSPMDFCHKIESPAIDFASLLNEYYGIDLNQQQQLLPASILLGEENTHLTLNFIKSSSFIHPVPRIVHPEINPNNTSAATTQLPVQQSEQPTIDFNQTSVSTHPEQSGIYPESNLYEPSAYTSHRNYNLDFDLNESLIENDEEDIN